MLKILGGKKLEQLQVIQSGRAGLMSAEAFCSVQLWKLACDFVITCLASCILLYFLFSDIVGYIYTYEGKNVKKALVKYVARCYNDISRALVFVIQIQEVAASPYLRLLI
jgi:hypothetical protein